LTVIFSGSNNNHFSSRWRWERWHWVDEVQGGYVCQLGLDKKNYYSWSYIKV